ncbi:MAG: tetratricopeptide repeat protein [Rhodospirillales bacterium]|nr:tetratricopeptide repeat protein [Rhodospirillales bacterium]
MEEATNRAEAARRLDSAAPEPLFVLGLAAFALNDIGAAIRLLEEAHRIDPDGREIAEVLGALHGRAGNLADSLYYTKLAVALDENPRLARLRPESLLDFVANVGQARQSAYLMDASIEFFIRRFDKAADLCRRELQLHPESVEAHQLMGRVLIELGRYEDATGHLERAAHLAPSDSAGFSYWAEGLRKQGRLDVALKCCREAVRLAPASAVARCQLLTTLAYMPSTDWGMYAEEAKAAVAAIAPGSRPAPPVPAIEPKTVGKERRDKIRVAFLVNETTMLRDIGFLETVLANHDPSRFYFYVYQQYSRPFGETPRLQKEAEDWRPIYNIDDETLAVIVANDAVDVLVDMCGAAPDGRIAFLANRPAPVQISWLGFPQGSLPGTVDCLLADPATVAFDERDSGGVALHVLDCGLIGYMGASVEVEAEGETEPPAAANGFTTFGGVLDPARIAGSAALWAPILREISDARLLLGRAPAPDQGTRDRILGLFDRHGVADRIVFQEALERQSPTAAFYSSVDILLDSTPVNGTVETCEALWRGVPAISCRGDRRAGRIGASLLAAAGRPDWVADTPEEFAALARRLVSDRSALAALRKSLPDEFRKSRLCDAKRFAGEFGAMLEGLVAAARAKAKKV